LQLLLSWWINIRARSISLFLAAIVVWVPGGKPPFDVLSDQLNVSQVGKPILWMLLDKVSDSMICSLSPSSNYRLILIINMNVRLSLQAPATISADGARSEDGHLPVVIAKQSRLHHAEAGHRQGTPVLRWWTASCPGLDPDPVR
jgi:hypothetical protein